jgi:hypothetical protein
MSKEPVLCSIDDKIQVWSNIFRINRSICICEVSAAEVVVPFWYQLCMWLSLGPGPDSYDSLAWCVLLNLQTRGWWFVGRWKEDTRTQTGELKWNFKATLPSSCSMKSRQLELSSGAGSGFWRPTDSFCLQHHIRSYQHPVNITTKPLPSPPNFNTHYLVIAIRPDMLTGPILLNRSSHSNAPFYQ